MRLQGKVAVVTGGSRGVGRAVCLAFAREGADVVVNYATRLQAAEEVVREVEKMGRKAVAVGADVASWQGAESVVKAAIDKFGKIDVLVNNAGFIRPAMLHKMNEEDWQAVIDIHLKAPWLCIKAAFPHMTQQKSGSIINVTSVAGVVGTVGQINYSAAKGGVIALTKSAARELAQYGIRVNCICLGIVETEMSERIRTDPKLVEIYKRRILLGRFATPEEAAEAFVFLASDASSYITGQLIMVDGGYGMT
ncbi:MAG: 3-oxoacyl-ACP reductase [Deltaproteobacteria bacterium]|nr:MAG: 3-oxoacyl-ACP reductase [Deltaproteobacteria bacterium]